MRTTRQLNRRSFLSAVSAGAVTGGAFALIGGTARAQTGPWTGVTDSDSGNHADNAGHGRGPGGNASTQPALPQRQTGCSDNDGGGNADPSGAGRRCHQRTGATDSDPTDPSGNGRGALNSGGGTVRANQRRPDGICVHHTGRTDSDSGAVRDPSGYGHGGSPGSNRLPPQHCQ